MNALEPTATIIDCILPDPSTDLSAVHSLCGRPLFTFAARAAEAATSGPIYVRVATDERSAYLRCSSALARLRIMDDVELAAQLQPYGQDTARVLCGYLPYEAQAMLPGASDAGVRLVSAEALRLALATHRPLLECGREWITSTAQLAAIESDRYARHQARLLQAGVVIHGNVLVDEDVHVEPGAVLETGVSLRGSTRVHSGARIDIGSVLTDVVVEPRAFVKPYTVASKATIGEAAEVGPFSHLRDGSEIHRDARIGNFVETKNVIVRARAMANHLAYMGDGDVGEGANISAGTIFCNSDGVNKHRTEVGARAFVGSDCQLVAPVKVGAGAFVATGTTVTKDVPADALAISRAAQVNKLDYAPRLRAKFAATAAERKRNPTQ